MSVNGYLTKYRNYELHVIPILWLQAYCWCISVIGIILRQQQLTLNTQHSQPVAKKWIAYMVGGNHSFRCWLTGWASLSFFLLCVSCGVVGVIDTYRYRCCAAVRLNFLIFIMGHKQTVPVTMWFMQQWQSKEGAWWLPVYWFLGLLKTDWVESDLAIFLGGFYV